jgi:hypothetical protein
MYLTYLRNAIYQLKHQDRLFSKNSQDYIVGQIEQIIKPSELYQIILEKKRAIFLQMIF